MDAREFLASVPPITRFLVFGTLAVTVAANWGLLNPMHLVLTPELYERFHFWRAGTSLLFFGMLSFNLLIHLSMVYMYSKQLEQEQFLGRTADYAFFVSFISVLLIVIGLLRGYAVLNYQLGFAIIYLWSQLNHDRMVSFYFGTRFKAAYLPLAIAALMALTGGSIEPAVVGSIVGHLYYHLEYALPASGQQRWLKTPAFFYHMFPPMVVAQGGVGGSTTLRAAAAPPAQEAPMPGSYRWGQGVRLGTN